MSSVFDVVYWWSVAEKQRRQKRLWDDGAHQPAVQNDSMTRVCAADKSTVQQWSKSLSGLIRLKKLINGQSHLPIGGIAASAMFVLPQVTMQIMIRVLTTNLPFTWELGPVSFRVKWRLISPNGFSTSVTVGQTTLRWQMSQCFQWCRLIAFNCP